MTGHAVLLPSWREKGREGEREIEIERERERERDREREREGGESNKE